MEQPLSRVAPNQRGRELACPGVQLPTGHRSEYSAVGRLVKAAIGADLPQPNPIGHDHAQTPPPQANSTCVAEPPCPVDTAPSPRAVGPTEMWTAAGEEIAAHASVTTAGKEAATLRNHGLVWPVRPIGQGEAVRALAPHGRSLEDLALAGQGAVRAGDYMARRRTAGLLDPARRWPTD